ncbi:intermembrane lipid transfer protein VPS13A-like [Watersipora subatra]|uniref:intermembrane lipid transfer protein VPS13A-like n=1 Tax=Watersipora subatra TaxID=2589382 RepID=UPI00355C410C
MATSDKLLAEFQSAALTMDFHTDDEKIDWHTKPLHGAYHRQLSKEGWRSLPDIYVAEQKKPNGQYRVANHGSPGESAPNKKTMFSAIGQSLVSWLLRKYLDQYVEDIEAHIKGFQYGLSGGTLVLDNLNLKAEALVELDLPIEVKAGHIETLKACLPAPTKLLTDPLIVTVENVFLLASPTCDRQYDEAKDELIQQAHKRQLLEKLEQLLQQEGKEEEEGPVKDPGFMEKIKVTALQNLELEIANIHIRYEDDVTNHGKPFAFGITLQELSLRPTVSTEGGASHQHVDKLLKLKELAVYWNQLKSKSQMLKDSLAEFKNAMACSIDENQLKGVTFDHLISPINGSAELIVNMQEKSKKPVVTCSGCFNHININFKRHMFLNAVILKDSFALMRVNEKYRKYHPGVSCPGNAVLWWRYAYDSIVHEIIIPKQQFWTRIWDYRHKYKKYRDLYTKNLLSPDNHNEAAAAGLEECEMSLNIESIVMARKEAEKEYLVQKPSMAVVKPANESVFSRLSNWWYAKPKATEVVVHAKHSAHEDDWWSGLSEKERQEIYSAFDYRREEPSDSASISVSDTYVKYAIDVKFEGIQCNLLMNTEAESIHIASLYVEGIEGQLAVRTQGFKLESTINHLEVFQSMDPTNRKFLAKIDNSTISDGTCSTNYSDIKSFLSVMVEQYPLDIDADVSIKVQSLPLRLVYDHEVACATMAFFFMPVKKYALGTTLKSFSPEFSTAGLQYAIDKNTRVHVEATLCSPYLVIPSDGVLSPSCSELTVDFGILNISTELRPKNLRLENESLKDRERAIYDKYTLDLSDVKILYTTTDAKDTCKKRCLKDSDIHVMPALSLLSIVSISAEPNFRKLPKFKVESKLNCLQLKLSTSAVESLLTTLYTFPTPSAHEFTEKYRFSAGPSPIGSVDMDCVDNVVDQAGLDYVLRSELRSGNILHDEIDFERLQRLENKDIFVTQGDLLNLWFLMSKETEAKDKKDGGVRNEEAIGGLNDVADYLLRPDEPDGRSVRLHDYRGDVVETEDDEEFVLADDTEPFSRLELPGLNGYAGTEFYTLLYTAFTIDGMSVKLKCGQQDYLSASVEGVAGRVCKTSCCLSISVQMRRLRITDDLHLDANRSTLHLACSPESQAMASFEGCFMDDVSKVTFTQTANAVCINLATIQLCLHDESTKQILQEAKKIMTVWNVLQKTKDPQRLPTKPTKNVAASSGSFCTEKDVFFDAVSRLDTASLLSRRSLQSLENTPGSNNLQQSKSLHDNPCQVVWDIRCCLKSIQLDVQKSFNIIARLDLSDVTFDYVAKNDLWSVDGKLGALSLFNPKAAIYKQVLVVEEGLKDVMTFHFTSFDRSVNRSESCDQEVKLKLRRMRLVFVNKFISRLTKYFGQFSIPADETVNMLSRQMSTTALVVQKEGTTTRIDVNIKAPLIIVPENGQSHNALLFQLGDLSLDNEFVTEQLAGQTTLVSQKFDQMSICLRNMAVERIKYVNERKYLAIRHLLTPVTTKVMFKRALAPIAKSAVDYDVKASINQFKVEATQLDMQFLGKVLYENVLLQNESPQTYGKQVVYVTDVGSTISSALSSTGSATTDEHKALSINLCLSNLLVYLKKEQPPSNSLQSITSDLAILNTAELKLDFCKRRNSRMSCVVTVRDFTIEDKVVAVEDECSTNRVIQLDDSVSQVLFVKYDMEANGDSNLYCAVTDMRFNVNLPFVRGIYDFLQESFTTWKSPEPPKPQKGGRRHRVRRRKRKTAVVTGRISQIAAPKIETAADGQNSKMVIEVKLGKQSLYIITGDGSHKALVAEMNLFGKAEFGPGGKQEGNLQLTELSVYVTSLQSDQSHLKHMCLAPCEVSLTYKAMSQPKESAPVKMDVKLFLTKIDIKLSTNVIYHVFDAMELFKANDVSDDVATGGHESNEADLGIMKDMDRNEWLDHHYPDDDIGNVEMKPTKTAVESLSVSEFQLCLEFAVAIGEEFVPILKTNSCLSGSVMDWSTRIRAECCFSLESNYYNELLDVWEPLVECIFDEKTNQYRRWEILARLTTAKSHPIAKTDPNEILVDSQELDTFIHHLMSSTKEREDNFLPSVSEDIMTVDEVDHPSASRSHRGLPEGGALAGRDTGVYSGFVTVISRLIPQPTILEEDEDDDEDDYGLAQRPLLATAGVPSSFLLLSKDKPEDLVEITSQVPPAEPELEQVTIDESLEDVDERKSVCRYISLVSRDRLLVNATPQGLNVITSVVDGAQ